MQRPMSRLIVRLLHIQALSTNSLELSWDLFREQVFMISQHYLRRFTPSWILPLLTLKIIFLILSLEGLGRDAKRRKLRF